MALTPLLIGCVGAPVSNSASTSASSPRLEVTPSSVSFASAVVGEPNSQTLKISNSGNGSLTISQISVRGSGLSISGFSGPVVLIAGASASFNVQLSASTTGPVNGSISIATSSPASGTTLPVSGEVVKANLALTVGPTSVSFGTIAGGKAATENVVLTNNGNVEVTVSKITVSGAGFSITGASVPIKLASSQSATVDVQFSPTVTGSYSGMLTVASNASNSSVAVPLSGKDAGTPNGATHWVGLNWNQSASAVFGYNVYRSSTSKGPFTKLNASLVTELSYSDSSVTPGATYFYVTTAVNGSGEESSYSNSAEAVVP